MNETKSILNERRDTYEPPSLRSCQCVTEKGFTQSSDFNDLDFDNRDDE